MKETKHNAVLSAASREKLKTEYVEAQKRASAENANVVRLRELLAQDCEHPGEFVSDYRWEHDNGYGRQTWLTGKRCQICFSIDHWNRGIYVSPKDCTYD